MSSRAILDDQNTQCVIGKVVVSGLGRNGFAVLLALTEVIGVRQVIGLVRKPSDIKKIKGQLRAARERHRRFGRIDPVITMDPSQTRDAQFWINFKGVNLATWRRANPDFEEQAKKRGIHLRDLLLEANLGIAIKDAKLALKFAPHCVYLAQGNPCDVLVRAIHKLGWRPGQVMSTGTMMEYYRLAKLLSYRRYKGRLLTMDESSGLCIGEHGENAVLLADRISCGGATLQELGLAPKQLRQIFNQVKGEAAWIRVATGETPYQGPAAVTCYLVERFLHPQKCTIVGACRYVGQSRHFGVRDVALSLPLMVGKGGAGKVVNIKLKPREKKDLAKAVAHLKAMARLSDDLAAQQGLYD